MTPTHAGIVKNGKLELLNRDRFLMWVGGLEGEVEVIVRKPKKDRTSQQNKLYWGYLDIISSDTGNTPDELHEFFKRKFLPPVFKVILGVEVRLPGSTTNLDTKQFGEYLLKIELLTGIPAPDPNDIYENSI